MQQLFPELTTRSGPGRTEEVSFWRRQFRQPRTQAQTKFDVVCGVVGPILCFVFDPIVFKSGLGVGPLLPEYQTFFYLFSGIEVLLLSLWLITGPGPEFSNSILGGALLTGGWVCLVIGCLLMPYSVMGLVLGIGILGFSPFVTGIVYARNGWRALCADSKPSSAFNQATGAVFGLLLVLGISIAISVGVRSAVRRSVDDILRGDAFHASHAAQRLSVFRFFAQIDLRPIVQAYGSELDENRKKLMRTCYHDITGEDLEAPALQD